MIEIKVNDNCVESAKIVGSGSQIITEAGYMIKSMCEHLSEGEEDEAHKLQCYAFFMTSIASAIVHHLDEEMVMERLKEFAENK